MSASSLAPFREHIHSPLLVIGAGQGFLMEALSRSGLKVFGIDSSTEMAQQAFRRRDVTLAVAEGQRLPFQAESFASIIVATGVLTSAVASDQDAIFHEALRALRKQGQIIAGLFSPSDIVLQVGQAIGYMSGRYQHQSRLLEIWEAGLDKEGWVSLVSSWTGTSTERATWIVQRYGHVLEAIHEDIERLAQMARRHGYEPTTLLRNGLDFCLYGFRIEEAVQVLRRYGLVNIRTHLEPEISTLTLMGTAAADPGP